MPKFTNSPCLTLIAKWERTSIPIRFSCNKARKFPSFYDEMHIPFLNLSFVVPMFWVITNLQCCWVDMHLPSVLWNYIASTSNSVDIDSSRWLVRKEWLCDTFGIVQELLIVQISWYCMITSLHWVCLLYEATILVYSLLFISVLHVCDEIMIIT
jgi:hypothetical protein